MNLQQIKYVIYTAECFSISQAARMLYVSQPNLSNAIKELEKELGIQIFERKKSGVSLTPSGSHFIKQVRPIMDQMEFIDDYYTHRREDKCSFRVACQHSSFAAEAMCEFIEGLEDEKYHIQILELKTKEMLEALQHGTCDVGVLLKNQKNKVLMWELEQRKLEFHLLATLHPHVFLQSSHPLAEKELITEEDLEPYPYSKYYQGTDSMQYFSEEVIAHKSKKTITITDKYTDGQYGKYLNAYTIGSGLRTKRFSSPEGKAIPYDSDELIDIGWVMSADKVMDEKSQRYIEILKKHIAEQVKP